MSKVEFYDGATLLATDNAATPITALVEYWNGTSWVSLGNVGTLLNQYNRIEFNTINTSSIRVSMSSNLATGILEARVWGY